MGSQRQSRELFSPIAISSAGVVDTLRRVIRVGRDLGGRLPRGGAVPALVAVSRLGRVRVRLRLPVVRRPVARLGGHGARGRQGPDAVGIPQAARRLLLLTRDAVALAHVAGNGRRDAVRRPRRVHVGGRCRCRRGHGGPPVVDAVGRRSGGCYV